jgi:hypothetical protein
VDQNKPLIDVVVQYTLSVNNKEAPDFWPNVKITDILLSFGPDNKHEIVRWFQPDYGIRLTIMRSTRRGVSMLYNVEMIWFLAQAVVPEGRSQ